MFDCFDCLRAVRPIVRECLFYTNPAIQLIDGQFLDTKKTGSIAVGHSVLGIDSWRHDGACHGAISRKGCILRVPLCVQLYILESGLPGHRRPLQYVKFWHLHAQFRTFGKAPIRIPILGNTAQTKLAT